MKANEGNERGSITQMICSIIFIFLFLFGLIMWYRDMDFYMQPSNNKLTIFSSFSLVFFDRSCEPNNVM